MNLRQKRNKKKETEETKKDLPIKIKYRCLRLDYRECGKERCLLSNDWTKCIHLVKFGDENEFKKQEKGS
jgi:hypothetical protein